MTASTVWLNGVRLGEYRGGFAPFGFGLTAHVDLEGDNVLMVEVDSTERSDIPPLRALGGLPDLRRHLPRSVLETRRLQFPRERFSRGP